MDIRLKNNDNVTIGGQCSTNYVGDILKKIELRKPKCARNSDLWSQFGSQSWALIILSQLFMHKWTEVNWISWLLTKYLVHFISLQKFAYKSSFEKARKCHRTQFDVIRTNGLYLTMWKINESELSCTYILIYLYQSVDCNLIKKSRFILKTNVF